MPELPEVETTRRGIEPHVLNTNIQEITIRQPKLRWPVPNAIDEWKGQEIIGVSRRAKYLCLETSLGDIVIHLGMSGSLRVCSANTPYEKHDHVDFTLSNGKHLRLRDPRRFGAVLVKYANERFPLFEKLGPEPLEDEFSGNTLYQASRNRKISVKQLIMDGHVVVGVGNIYASESLFLAGINPKRQAQQISLARYERLAQRIKEVLQHSIEQGGTTLRDFVSAEGQKGYFQIALNVYGKTDEPCPVCSQPIKSITLAQRNTFYCSQCQR